MPTRTFDPRPLVASYSDDLRWEAKLTADEQSFFDNRENREIRFLMQSNRNRNFS